MNLFKTTEISFKENLQPVKIDIDHKLLIMKISAQTYITSSLAIDKGERKLEFQYESS